MLRDADGDLALVRAQKVAVFGFGSQGRAHALNLRDSGVDVIVALLAGSRRRAEAEAEGLRVLEPPDAAREATLLALLVPDDAQAALFGSIAPALEARHTLLFAHGFAIRFRLIAPPPSVAVTMIAPIAPGRAVRSLFVGGGGAPAYLAVHQDPRGDAKALALSYGLAIGAGRAGLLETNFADECECDLFGEQVVVCGGISALITAAFDTLVRAGYAPEVAYLEVCHQVSLLAEMITARGIAGMRAGISPTALFGDLTRGPRVIGDASRQEMVQILAEIRDGRFAAELLADNAAGRPSARAGLAASAAHPIEGVGKKLRDAMDKAPEDRQKK